jgi:hypothetical protein
MTTYFRNTARNYIDVTITDEGINTDEFLQATEGLVGIFGTAPPPFPRTSLQTTPSLF